MGCCGVTAVINATMGLRAVPRLGVLGVLSALAAVANLAVAGIVFAGATSGSVSSAALLVLLGAANVAIGVWLLARVNAELAEVSA